MNKNIQLTVRGEVRRDAILSAAMDVFIERGFERTSLSSIIARSGGSRTLIYQCFGNKEGLFKACFEMLSKAVYARYLEEGRRGGTLEAELRIFGGIMLQGMAESRGNGALRLLVSETRFIPELGQWYYENVVLESYRCFARILDDFVVAGEADRYELSSFFIEALKGGVVQRALLCSEYQPSQQEIQADLDRAIARFMLYIGQRYELKHG